MAKKLERPVHPLFKKYTRDWLHEVTGYSRGYLSRVSTGNHRMNRAFIERVCFKLQMPESELFLPEPRNTEEVKVEDFLFLTVVIKGGNIMGNPLLRATGIVVVNDESKLIEKETPITSIAEFAEAFESLFQEP